MSEVRFAIDECVFCRLELHERVEPFTPGAEIEALDQSRRAWRKAVIVRNAPYSTSRGFIAHGAYIHWTDLGPNPPQWESSGGWHSAATIRERKS